MAQPVDYRHTPTSYSNPNQGEPFVLFGNELRVKSPPLLSPFVFWKSLLDSAAKHSTWNYFVFNELRLPRDIVKRWAILGTEVGFSLADLPHLYHLHPLSFVNTLIQAPAKPLIKAVCLRLPWLVERYLKEGSCPNVSGTLRKKEGSRVHSALKWALIHNDLETFICLYRHGAEMSSLGSSALWMCYTKRPQFTPWLIKEGLHKKGPLYFTKLCPVHHVAYQFALHNAVLEKDKKAILFLLQHGADINDLDRGESVVYIAANHGRLHQLIWLVQKGASIDNGKNPLTAAVEGRHYQCALWLLYHHPSLISPHPPWQKQPMAKIGSNHAMAILFQRFGALCPMEQVYSFLQHHLYELLVFFVNHELVHINFIDLDHPLSRPLFHDVIETGYIPLIHAFLKGNVNLNRPDKYGMTPLHLATLRGELPVVQLLVESGAAVNATTKTKMTPLHLAAMRGFVKIGLYLLENKASASVSDHWHAKALHISLRYPRNLPLTEALLKRGSKATGKGRRLYPIYKKTQYSPLEPYLKKSYKKPKHRWIESFIKTVLAHIYDVGGYSPIITRTPPQDKHAFIRLEGMYPGTWLYRRAVKTTKALFKRNSTVLPKESFATLLSSLRFASSFETPPEKTLDRIQTGAPTVIKGGYWAHLVYFVFFKNLFLICNRGGGKHQLLCMEAFVYDTKRIKKKHLDMISQVLTSSSADYIHLIKTLQKSLNCQSTPLTQAFEKSVPFSPQTKGHCVWNNLELAIWALVMLPIITNTTATKIPALAKQHTLGFEKWHALFGNNLTLKYLKFHLQQTALYIPDTYFISQIIKNSKEVYPEVQTTYKALLAIYPIKKSAIHEGKIDSDTEIKEISTSLEPTRRSIFTTYLNY